jgi:cysteine dioxygenase
MALAQGEVAVHNYKYTGCNAPENQNVVGLDCLAGATHIDMDRLHTDVCTDAPNAPVYCVDKLQTIHQIENTDKSNQGCISLHIYSLPFDSCVAYDMEHQRCFRKTLTYFSQYGNVEVDAIQSPDGKLKVIY